MVDYAFQDEADLEALDATQHDHGYPTSLEVEVESAAYLAGRVDRGQLMVLLRMGNEDTILEAIVDLGELEGIIDALEGNVRELTQVMALRADLDLDDAETISGTAKEAIGSGDYPLMALLWEYMEQTDAWAGFAAWVETVADTGSLTGAPDNG